jgi:pilus assembly protein CpaC
LIVACFSGWRAPPSHGWTADEPASSNTLSSSDEADRAPGRHPIPRRFTGDARPASISTGESDCPGFGDKRCTIDIEMHKSMIRRCERDITRAAIGDPNIADIQVITPRQVLIVAKNKPGFTNLILWHGKDHADLYSVRVLIPGDLVRAINDRLHQLVPGARVTALATDEALILNGTVAGQQTLARVLTIAESIAKGFDRSYHVDIVNLITVTGAQQVQLQVKIAEISRSAAKKMGLGFLFKGDIQAGLFPSGGITGTMSAYNAIIPKTTITEIDAIDQSITEYTTSGGLAQSLSSSMELLPTFGSAFQLALHGVGDDFMSILSLLKGQGLAHILATPTLVTMSGQEAEFLVGGEFPIPINGDGNDVTVQYKRYGIILRFTPFITGEETITIKVAPEVSNPDYTLSVSAAGVTVPGLKTRRGSTTLQLKDGQTFIMAGLLMEELHSISDKVPVLGDIPLLGGLFTRKEYEKNETELMVMVTPRLVRALNPDEVPEIPGSAHTGDMSDMDFFILNKTPDAIDAAVSRRNGPASENHAGDNSMIPGFQGTTGYIR